MKTKLTGLLLTVVTSVVLAQVPPPVPPPGKSRPISEPVRPVNPQAPANFSAVPTNAPGTPRITPNATAPEPFRAPAPLPTPSANLIAPAASATGTNVMGSLASRAAAAKDDAPKFALDQSLSPELTRLQLAPLDQVLDNYAELAGRTILRPATLPQVQITFKAQSELTVKETLQALDSLLSLNGIAVIPTGEKFLTVVPTQTANQEGAAFNTNSSKELPEAGQYITKIVEVKNAKPSEVVPAIQPFAKLQGGILPIDATGVLILRDNAINIKRMMEVLEKIDVAVKSDEEFKVIPINYALAADVAQVLGSLTSSGPASGGAGAASRTGGTTTRRGGGTSAFGGNTGLQGTMGATGAATPFGAQPGANTGIPGAAQPGTAQTQFQQRLNQIVSNITGGRTGGAPLLGEAKIIPYDRSNSLLVLATGKELGTLTNLLREIDVPQQQVLIEALIFETGMNHSLDVTFGVGQKTAATGNKFAGKGGLNSVINFSTNTTALGVGAVTGGFGYLAQIGNNWAAAIQLIESDSNTEILSRPRIQTSHAEAATIFSGGTTPYVTGTAFNTVGGSQSQIQQLQIGISMQVLPLITSDGLVVLDINQTIESEGDSVKIDATLSVPKTVRHQAQAKVAVKDGETIMLGGLIRTKRAKSVSGVPVLKDIPGLGVLFRSTSETPERRELMVLLRPTVLPTPQSASLAARAERERSASMRTVERSAREENAKFDKKLEEAEIEEMRKLMKKYPKGPIPLPASPFGEPAVPSPSPEKKGSTDFLEIPKTGTP